MGYSNKVENEFFELAKELGWRPTKKGWPDFVCYDDASGGVIFVEVKPPGHLLRKSQWTLMFALARLGAKCFVYSGHELRPFDPELPPDYYREDDLS